jgi:serine/threonine-protein kinase
VYHAALAVNGGARDALLDELCAGDETLRREVVSLLKYEGRARGFLSEPAINLTARGESAHGYSLGAGTQVGPYRILAPIGAGGMGDVYRARDAHLGRDVAIKILPTHFLVDPARRARFEREARLLGALNHAHIGAIYGLETIRGSHALVLEYIGGESLAQRVASGPLPVATALAIARQIAGALEAAHEKGIVHRDVKPANIMLTVDDQVKVVDFGLATALDTDDSSKTANSPTLTFEATQDGVILGTAAYMSPEQTQGRVADKRSDVWAFGCVLYEMLTGRRPFEKPSVSDTLVAVLRDDPDWSALPATVPTGIRNLMRRCLEKDRTARLPDMAVVRFLLDEPTAVVSPLPGVQPSHVRKRLIAVSAAGLLGCVATGLVVWTLMRGAPAEPIRLFISLTPPQSLATTTESDSPVAIDPSGRHQAFVGRTSPNGRVQLLVKSMDQLQIVAIAGTEGARDPLFSPDGEWIAYWSASVLKKVPRTGGPSQEISRVAGEPNGAAWLPDNSFIVATNDPRKGLIQVPARGGTPIVLTNPDQGERDHIYPSALPGGRAVLFTIASVGPAENSQVAVLDLNNRQRKILFLGGSDAQYVETGHLVYAASGTLRADRFDLAKLEVRGESVPVIDKVRMSNQGAAAYSISKDGTLVYVQAVSRDAAKRTLVWVDRDGREEPLSAEAKPYSHPRLSPDGTRLAVNSRDQDRDIWIFDLGRQTSEKLTSGTARELNPVWTPDSRMVLYASSREAGVDNVYRQLADGTGNIEPLTSGKNHLYPISIAPKGHEVVVVDGSDSIMTLAVLHLDGTNRITSLLQNSSQNLNGEVSPDGRWLAYQSDETGRYEIFVRPYPNTQSGAKRTISLNGGTKPLWARSGNELFYIDAEGYLMAVQFQTRTGSVSGAAKRVFHGRYHSLDELGRTYDVSPDGRRFLMLKGALDQTDIVVVLNWLEDLRNATR